MLKFINLFFILLILSSGLVIAQEEKKSEYLIAATDLLEIRVYEEPDLNKTVRVSADGKISFPFIGEIKVAGLTARELENSITELLARDYLVNPQVSVFITERSKTAVSIFILGKVKNPGSYEMREGLTLSQAIALAGGFTNEADTSAVKIVRGSDDKDKEEFEVDVDQIMNKQVPDVQIKGADTIVVNEYGSISIMGKVVRPGVYPFEKGLTVVKAVALAGGLTDAAAANATTVIRTKDGKKENIRVPLGSILHGGDKSLDIALEPGDTVVVPESFF